MSEASEPAFPIVASTGDPRDGVYTASGLTKREWFAGMALQGMIASCVDASEFPDRDVIAKIAYEYADAMLRATGET